MESHADSDPAKSPKNVAAGVGLILLALALAGGGVYVGETDDAPGAALLGLVLAAGLLVFGIKILRPKR